MKKLLLLSILFTTSLAFGQSGFRYRRALEGIKDQWHRIELPEDLYGKLDNSFHDLRILGITRDGDTIEVPYVLESTGSQEFQRLISSSAMHTLEDDGYFYFTFNTLERPVINRIDLLFSETNFHWDVRLEGSQNNAQWFTILDQYSLVSIQNSSADYDFTSLFFPDCSFRFYRLGVASEHTPILIQAGLWRHLRQTENVKQYAPRTMRVSQKGKQTIVDLEFAHAVPIDWLETNISSDFDYARPCEVYYCPGDTLPKQEKLRSYTLATRDAISSVNFSGISWKEPHIAKFWRLIIDNYDDEPLIIDSVKCSGPQYSLSARFSSKADYFLYYGDEARKAPFYDLNYFSDRIPETMEMLTLGPEESLFKEEVVEEPLLTSRWWLWSVLGIVILMLGGFTLKMLKSPRLEE